jgi:hypothetical protein
MLFFPPCANMTMLQIRDDGPGVLLFPVKMMKESKGGIKHGICAPLNKAAVLHSASEESIKARKAVTVLTYLHGVKEAMTVAPEIKVCSIPVSPPRSHIL